MNDAANIQAIRSERLKDLRTSMGISTKALADATGISVGSLNTWENDDATAGKTSTDGIKLENLIKLADFYGVSLDYLAGRTDVKSPSPTVQGVCEYTGLREKSVNLLHSVKETAINDEFMDFSFTLTAASFEPELLKEPDMIDIKKKLTRIVSVKASEQMLNGLNALLECDRIKGLLLDLDDYIKSSKKRHKDPWYDTGLMPKALRSEDVIYLEKNGYRTLSPLESADYAYFKVNNLFSDILKHEIVKEVSDDGEH